MKEIHEAHEDKLTKTREVKEIEEYSQLVTKGGLEQSKFVA